MGAGNALQVLHGWAHLPPNARFILLQMALTILDEDQRPRWWGGDDLLLAALGRQDPPRDDVSDEAERIRNANGATLRKAISDALRAGALEYAIRPSRHRSGEYWVRWSPGPLGVRIPYSRSKDSLQQTKESLQQEQGILTPEENSKRT